MAFRLKPHEQVKKGVRRIVRCELDHALENLADAKRDENKTVHDVRTHCKKIRATLRLVRDSMDDKVYHHENRCFRDTARPLTEVRDAQVQLKTLNKLSKNNFSTIRRYLQDDYQFTRARVLEKQPAFDTVAITMKGAIARLGNEIKGRKGWKALRHGLRHTYRQGRQACTSALQYPTTPNLHECRKQAKYLWYQLKILKSIHPQKGRKLIKKCHAVAQLLGDDHDLAVLRKTVTGYNDINSKTLLSLIDHRRKALQRKALRVGQRLYDDRPKIFIAQFNWPE